MESNFIKWLETVLPRQSAALPGIGDDAAVWDCSHINQQVVTSDSLVDDIHFRSVDTALGRIGHKCLAASLSDLAAMCCRPKIAIVSLISPRDWSLTQLQDFYTGILSLAEQFDCRVIGGDFNTHTGPFTVNVTAIGESTPTTVRYRLGSQAGDSVYVTGSLGGSLQGHHLDFIPRIEQGLLLGRDPAVHSVTDLTDGLVVDLNSMLAPAGRGAILDPDLVPLSPSAQSQSDPLTAALYDGEDFELIFTACSEFNIQRFNALSSVNATRLGQVDDVSGIRLKDHSNAPLMLHPVGYSH